MIKVMTKVMIMIKVMIRGGPGPRPDRLGLKCYLAWGGTRVVGGRGRGAYFIIFLRQTNKCTFFS